ncbi:MAG TPA: cupin domain-containing protein, partial [Thermomicrobiales bacterium]|nr:cupin domain-containing protein [Thermomicrobiales bacterium]
MDALSELLRALRLKGAVFIDAELSAPWAIRTPSPRSIANVMMPDAQRIIPYHFVIEGKCWIRLPGEEAIPVRAGEVALFPHGDVHDLFSGPD